MTRRMLFWAILPLLLIALAGVAQAWQGRMGGMGDPYGLISDESDFLIHPAKIATGEGIRFYGDYRFTYTDVMDWDADFDDWPYEWDFSGDEYRHDALVGAAFPLGTGRMGIFFTYAGHRGDYDGNYDYTVEAYETMSDLDDFAVRLLYGLPADGVSLGIEAQVAYRQEQQESYQYYTADPDFNALNNAYFGWWNDWYQSNWVPLGFFPYDSSYWEALLKGSAEFAIGPADCEFVLRGGFIVSGDNEWETEYYHDDYDDHWREEMDGAVGGWQIGGDLWVRYPLNSGLSLPFLLRIDYQDKTRDGEFSEPNGPPGWYTSNHEITEKSLDLEVGGGLDKELGAGTRIAGGIYYNYLQNKDRRTYAREDNYQAENYTTDFKDDLTEHRVVLRLAGEHELSPMFALRAGLNAFYGWAELNAPHYWEEIYWDGGPDLWTYDMGYTADGSHWGIGASLGGTIRFNGFALEPFVTGGWQQLALDGDGMGYYFATFEPPDTDFIKGDLTRSEWFISGGLSILFDL